MKTPEDEAFDDLAKRQGAWGGGFPAKKAMAADKLQEPACDKDPQGCWNVRCQLGKQCKNLAQPAQEPTNYLHAVLNAFGLDEGISLDQKAWSQLHAAVKEALAQPAQEPTRMLHIERLDKWLDASLKERKQREWVGLTEDELLHIGVATGLKRAAAQMIANKLKEKNT